MKIPWHESLLTYAPYPLSNFLYIPNTPKICYSPLLLYIPLSHSKARIFMATIQILDYPPPPLWETYGFIYFCLIIISRALWSICDSNNWYGKVVICDFLNQGTPIVHTNCLFKPPLKMWLYSVLSGLSCHSWQLSRTGSRQHCTQEY